MSWQTFLFLPLAIVAFGYSGKKVFALYKMAAAHTGKSAVRWDRIPERVSTTILNVLFQKKVMQKRSIGILHAMIFWGFMVITVGTVEQFLSTLHSSLHFSHLIPSLYGPLVYIQDIFTGFVLFGVVGAFIRRAFIRPKHLGQSSDAFVILGFTSMLMVAIFLMNAFDIVGNNPFYADSMPISNAIAKLFSTVDASVALSLSIVFKWVHMLIVMFFAMYIPSSKHLHVLAAGPNTFLQTLDRAKGMKKINFEDETVTQYGAAKATDLSWKDALDYYSCTECGRCQEVCPAWNTEKPLSPSKLIHDLKVNLWNNQTAIFAGKAEEVTPVIGTSISEDVIWACTSCRACEVACPVFIEHTDKIFDIRRDLVMMQSKFPAEVQAVFKNMETNASPWAFAASDRANWTAGTDVKKVSDLGSAAELDILLWVGCAGSFDDRNKKVLKSFVNILNKANVKFAILGNEEQCTGDPARRIGNEYLFQTLATANVETLNRYNVKKVVTACPHCFNTLKNEYKDFGGNYEVIHHSQYIAQLMAQGKITPKKSVTEKVTYHDSCYMGRWNGEYEAPRSVLQQVSSQPVIEIAQNKDKAMCCGAGGGRMFMEEHIGRRVNVTRTEQALATGATVIAANCPFCMTMLTDGIKTKEKQDSVRVMDIAELVDSGLS